MKILRIASLYFISALGLLSQEGTDFLSFYRGTIIGGIDESSLDEFLTRRCKEGLILSGIDWIEYDDFCEASREYIKCKTLEVFARLYKEEIGREFSLYILQYAIRRASKIDVSNCTDPKKLLFAKSNEEFEAQIQSLIEDLNSAVDGLVDEKANTRDNKTPARARSEEAPREDWHQA